MMDMFTIDTKKIQAVLFDLDGVVTKTAKTHATAWKELFDEYLHTKGEAPFEEEDYRKYVDGRPRYDGVETFLKSRGIDLPRGTPEDSPEEETICGLGNRKNRIFHKVLKEHGVECYESTIALIKKLREKGVKTAIVSSSKNSSIILEAANITDLFDTCVDGLELEKLFLPGKPEPDMFLEAAKRVGAEPNKSIVVEDAISGVQAGKKGGFIVIGVDRTNTKEAFSHAGADTVVNDLSLVGVA
jgi:alpha,alpha-trehalase